MKIELPELCLVTLIGASGSGKSTFGRAHFGPFEVVSSDFCRGVVSDDENDQKASRSAFALLHTILHHRLKLGRLTVVDATNVRPEDRKELVTIAREHHVLPVAIVFDLPEQVCHERNRERDDRNFGPHVIRGQRGAMRRSLKGLRREGFRHVFTFKDVKDIEAATVVRTPLWNNRKEDEGPFDVIGDLHGCYDELIELFGELGYDVAPFSEDGVFRAPHRVRPPMGRKAVFLGDLADRGPKNADTFKLVMEMVEEGVALCVPGNHDVKLLRKLRGKNVRLTHGLERTVAEIEKEDEAFLKRLEEFLGRLVSHYVLDGGRLVVAHAGLKESLQGRASGRVREFCLYGETTGETDEYGFPVRLLWAADYSGEATVVYGHTPVSEPEWLNRTINIDTGCVFGGRLTALRYPERELLSVPARETYADPVKPLGNSEGERSGLSAQHRADDVLDLEDVFGKRIVGTKLQSNVTIREENAAAALESMSRFAANPKWLIYLPPTVSPSETSSREGFLEHPDEAFAYYRNQGVSKIVCQDKHMGSRAVVVLCRNEEAARDRFGVVDEGIGLVYTRTGRRFFAEEEVERGLLERIRSAADACGLWEELGTEWVCLDCELMPWSAKAKELLRRQYAAVGAAGGPVLSAAASLFEKARVRIGGTDETLGSLLRRRENLDRFVTAYRQYCWSVDSLSDLRLAPFHLLASEGRVHFHCDHLWHMEWSRRLSEADGEVLMATRYRQLETTDEGSLAEGVEWWQELTASGGEGMMVKSLETVARGRRGLVQPAIKCRGREYLRIIYGPDYTEPEHLERLRGRGLARKRGLAIREFALGLEALERFVRREPLRRVHECVFGVLALESEPVDPRL